MTRLSLSFLTVALTLAAAVPARAVPPTVAPSPGYDARLAEQRKAAQASPAIIPPAPKTRHGKPKH